MGTFSAGWSLLVTNFLEYIPSPGIWPFWNPIVSVSNRVIARNLEGEQRKNGRGGGKVIPTLTTLSVNSAGRLALQARIPITSYWTSQNGLFWCWIRQKLKFTVFITTFSHFFLSRIYGWPLKMTMIIVKRLLPVIYDFHVLFKKTLVI